MPKLEYFLVAESCSDDRETGRISVFNILENVSAKLPAHIPSVVAVSSWLISPDEQGEEFQAILRGNLPGKEEPQEFKEFPVNFIADGKRQRILHHLKAIPLCRAGELEFEILLNGKHAAGHIVTVVSIQEDA